MISIFKLTKMKTMSSLPVALLLMLAISNRAAAQDVPQDDPWPRIINTQDGSVIKIYEPQPESFSGNTLKMRQAVSLLQSGKTDPVFGTYWAVATVQTDRDNRRINIESVKVPNVKFSDDVDDNTVSFVKNTLESEIPNVEPDLAQDDIMASIESNTQAKNLSKNLETNPPKIYYSSKPSLLVLIDGTPKLQHNDSWGLDAVVNTPFTIVKNNDGKFYLYGGNHWYKAAAATGPYAFVSNIPANLNQIQTAVDNANASDPGYSSDSAAAQPNVISDIIVSTTPAELLQTNGAPTLTSIDGTDLSYVDNSQNDIIQSQSDNQYYALISGRWYKAPGLKGPWTYTAATALPADFAKIPEGSPKDNVLASVAGTDAARDAVMDAQIPQTAKVDRATASADVNYDGDPQFSNIDGTNMQYAVNTQSSVIFDHGNYYSVDNGVWFQSTSATGPWVVCTDRPDDVDLIPPSYPVYNMKYVYIYDVNPDYVYMGYTPGYLNAYIYGPTVVYGTGYYYKPWRGHYYYPRQTTWGFNVHYNPWNGWSLGYNYRFNWFHVGFGATAWNGWRGGWWGPAVYRPPYRTTAFRTHGFYGRPAAGIGARPAFRNNNNRINNSFRNNIYNTRRDVVTVNNNRGYRPANNNNNRPGGFGNNRPGGMNNTNPGNNNRGQNQPDRNNPGQFNRGQQGQPNNGQGQQQPNRPQGQPNNGQVQQRPDFQPNNGQTQTRPAAQPNNGQPQSNRPQVQPNNGQGQPQNRPDAQPNNGQAQQPNRPQGQPNNGQAQQPTRPATPPQARPEPGNNNITTDASGNVYQRTPGNNNTQQWQQRTQSQWKPVDNTAQQTNLNRQQQMQDRGQQRTQNFQSARQEQPRQQVQQPRQQQPQPARNIGGGNGGGNRPARRN